MRVPRVLRVLCVLLVYVAAADRYSAQTCTGLCLQQVSCPKNGTTTISGKVYAPNGVDPLPNVLVYIPNAPVDAFTPGVSCGVAGQQPSGSPLVGTVTGVDGSYTLTNVPVGTNIPLVAKLGRWRRQVVVPVTIACADTAFSTRLPRNHLEGDIPKIAVVTSATDRMECALRATGVDDAEFTDASGTGRIHLYLGDNYPGARMGAGSGTESSLMGSAATLNQYDIVMLPSQGNYDPALVPPGGQANFAGFVNAGGRAYLSHLEMSYLENNPNLPAVQRFPRDPPYTLGVEWEDQVYLSLPPPRPALPPYLAAGPATVNPYLGESQEMAKWLQGTGVTTTLGQIPYPSTPQDVFSIYSATESWITNPKTDQGAGVMQFVARMPYMSAPANECGRIVYDDYEIEGVPLVTPLPATTFPVGCKSGFQSPQESVFEWALFELTPDQEASLVPAGADFGSLQVGYTSAPQTFTWSNNSAFPVAAYPTISNPDFGVLSSNCASVPASATCQVQAVFTPTTVGQRSGTLTVTSNGLLSTATAFLTGIGLPDLTVSPVYLNFGTHDVGSSSTLSVTVTNGTTITVPFPAVSTTGDYSATSACPAALAPMSSCQVSVTFAPRQTGVRLGTLILSGGQTVALLGEGAGFSVAVVPGSGQVEAGFPARINLVGTPMGGYAGTLTVSCVTDAPAATCAGPQIVLNGSGPVTSVVVVTTVSKYTVPGYSGVGGWGWLWVAAAVTGWQVGRRRRSVDRLAAALLMLVLVAILGGLGGCSGKYPTLNSSLRHRGPIR